MRTPEQVIRALSNAESALLCMHIGPDGDTMGSALALAAALEALGKRVALVCADPVPPLYAFLPVAERIAFPDALGEARFDLAIAIDVSDAARLGSARALFDVAEVRAVIDHHGTNDCFGTVNWIEPTAAATGVMVLDCVAALGVPLSQGMADCLYVAIATDTGNFSFPNTNAPSLHAAAALVEAGAQPDRLIERVYRTRARAGVELLGRALGTLRVFAEGKAALMTLSAEDFAQTGAIESMTEGIVNYAIEIAGVEMAALLRERSGEVRCSLRGRAPRDVAGLAQRFSGGGHKLAAGCSLPLPLQDAAQTLAQAMKQALE